MSESIKIDPIRIYEIKGEVCKLTPAPLDFAVGNNQSVVAAVTGKIHRIMGMVLQGAVGATIARMSFKSNSGGSLITGGYFAPSGVTNGGAFILPIVDAGYGETSAGHGIFADVVTTNMSGTLFYITYTA